jgi:hypothetical protein
MKKNILALTIFSIILWTFFIIFKINHPIGCTFIFVISSFITLNKRLRLPPYEVMSLSQKMLTWIGFVESVIVLGLLLWGVVI